MYHWSTVGEHGRNVPGTGALGTFYFQTPDSCDTLLWEVDDVSVRDQTCPKHRASYSRDSKSGGVSDVLSGHLGINILSVSSPERSSPGHTTQSLFPHHLSPPTSYTPVSDKQSSTCAHLPVTLDSLSRRARSGPTTTLHEPVHIIRHRFHTTSVTRTVVPSRRGTPNTPKTCSHTRRRDNQEPQNW